MDTSCLVAMALDEPGSGRTREVLGTIDRVLSCTLMEAEFLCAMQREGMREAAHRFLAQISWVKMDRRLSDELLLILDLDLDLGHMRGADLHHLATALSIFRDPTAAFFLTLDSKQGQMARRLGFQTL